MANAKLKAKLGNFEVEFEGDESFLKTEVTSLVEKIVSALGELPPAVNKMAAAGSLEGAKPSSWTGAFDHSTNTVASIIGAKTGPDLAMAAAATLSLCKGQDKFARKEILDEMQGATTFYNQNYSGNLSKILISLTKLKKLNLVGKDTYALTKSERDGFEAKLAQAV